MNKVPEGRLQLLMIAVPKISHCWKEIGIQLHFTREELETIDRGIHPQNVEDCCKEMLLLWKNQTKASADILIYAIKEAGNAAYAEDLKKGLHVVICSTIFLFYIESVSSNSLQISVHGPPNTVLSFYLSPYVHAWMICVPTILAIASSLNVDRILYKHFSPCTVSIHDRGRWSK